MKQSTYFDSFLATHVNLNQTRLDQLKSRVTAIVNVLKGDDVIGDNVTGAERQGSWAQRTIIKPQKTDEFDADILLHLDEVPGWAPREYLRIVRRRLQNSTTYRGKVQKKNRCVRVVYAGACHVDVVPTVALADGRQVIVNWASDEFEDTNPDGFTDWMRDQDEVTGGNLRKCIRLLKFLRDSKDSFDIPSVILTLLLGEQVEATGAAERYKDVPTTLVSLLTDLNLALQGHPVEGEMPEIRLPRCPGPPLNHRWDDPTKIANFRAVVARYAQWASEAHAATEPAAILRGWQRLFGDKFAPGSDLEPAIPGASTLAQAAGTRHHRECRGEEFIESEFGFAPRYDAEIVARVLPKDGFRAGLLSMLKLVGKHRRVRFEFRTTTPGRFDLRWKVRNFGEEAGAQLRGELMQGDDQMRIHEEPTAFAGDHWIEAYAVQGGEVVAWAHCPVPIR